MNKILFDWKITMFGKSAIKGVKLCLKSNKQKTSVVKIKASVWKGVKNEKAPV